MIGLKAFPALMLFMQWLHYPTPGVPRLANGSPNLEAPTPRTPDVSRCLPGGLVKLHTTPLFRKIIQIPGLIVALHEMDATYRQIFTDGRPLPPIDIPSFKGYSSGKWEKDVLVVETTGFPDGMWLDRSGTPMTDAAKITERFRRVNYGRMEIEITVDDPKAYTAPWTIKLNHNIVLDTELIDYICAENEKDAGRLIGK